MALNTYPDAPEFIPMIAKSYTAVLGDEATDKHVFDMPRPVSSAIAQIKTATTGVVNHAGLSVKIIEETSSAPCKVEVAVTALVTGDTIDLLAW